MTTFNGNTTQKQVYLWWSADGTTMVPVSATNPLPVTGGGGGGGGAVTIANGADVALGSTTDAKSTATDGTAATGISLLKEISFMEQNPVSRAVTNAGTFLVQAAQSGTWTVGLTAGQSLAANQSVNVSQINAVTPLMGNGVTGAGATAANRGGAGGGAAGGPSGAGMIGGTGNIAGGAASGGGSNGVSATAGVQGTTTTGAIGGAGYLGTGGGTGASTGVPAGNGTAGTGGGGGGGAPFALDNTGGNGAITAEFDASHGPGGGGGGGSGNAVVGNGGNGGTYGGGGAGGGTGAATGGTGGTGGQGLIVINYTPFVSVSNLTMMGVG